MATGTVVATPRRTKRILVCDDERNLVRLVQMWLQQRGHHVVPCYSGYDALEQLRADQFDLLILDVMMPGMDGFEVLKEIRGDEMLADQKVILLTAKSSDADVFKGYAHGANLYLTKPTEASELLPFVERL